MKVWTQEADTEDRRQQRHRDYICETYSAGGSLVQCSKNPSLRTISVQVQTKAEGTAGWTSVYSYDGPWQKVAVARLPHVVEKSLTTGPYLRALSTVAARTCLSMVDIQIKATRRCRAKCVPTAGG